MKFNVEVDCTPEEARAFLGLPDVKPIQDAMSAHLEERIMTAMTMFDPDTLLKSWFPLGMSGMEQFQNAFRAAAADTTKSTKSTKAKE